MTQPQIIILTIDEYLQIPIWKLKQLHDQGWSADYETTSTWVMLSNKNQYRVYGEK